ncbi:hypothetical protein GCM10027515_04340 [Schumannella luteola]|uniref:Uncharacterized protein n=1 Tax=Schumannella luteola TaxID=472059 RepID=A0A852YAP8_9MICO|nr:hypothetical protein [Schumannella luteola]NYG98430.1 hypothetical protein [Schumannella luteola]
MRKHVADGRPSDAPVEPAVTDDGALAPTSDAGGAGTAADVEVPEDERPPQTPSERRPESLVDGNRVATADDME